MLDWSIYAKRLLIAKVNIKVMNAIVLFACKSINLANQNINCVYSGLLHLFDCNFLFAFPIPFLAKKLKEVPAARCRHCWLIPAAAAAASSTSLCFYSARKSISIWFRLFRTHPRLLAVCVCEQ